MELLKHLNDEKSVNLQHSRFEKALQPSEAKIKEMKPRKGGPQNFQNFGKLLQVQQNHELLTHHNHISSIQSLMQTIYHA